MERATALVFVFDPYRQRRQGRQARRQARTRLQDRILFGSDYPFIMPQRWLADFDTLEGFKPEVRQKILHDNAARILKL